MIRFRQTGDWSKTTNFLKRAKQRYYLKCLDKYGQRGVASLSSATPVDTGKTAGSWSYEIKVTETRKMLDDNNKLTTDKLKNKIVEDEDL